MFLLLDCKMYVNRRVTDAKTYGEVALFALGIHSDIVGQTSQRFVDMLLLFVQFDVCIVYFDFISDNMHAFFPWLPQRVLIFGVAVVISILSMKQDLGQISTVAYIAFFSISGAILLVIMQAIAHWDERPIITKGFELEKMPLFVDSLLYCFVSSMIAVLPMESEIEDTAEYPRILGTAMIVVMFTYVLFGQVCLLSFGDIDNESMSAYLETRYGSTWVSNGVNMMVTAAAIFTFPIQLYPALQVLEQKFGFRSVASSTPGAYAEVAAPGGAADATEEFGLRDPQSVVTASAPLADKRTYFPLSVFRMLVIFLLAIVSVIVPQLRLAMALGGSIGGCMLALVFPPLMDLMLLSDEAHATTPSFDLRLRKIRDYFIISIGIVGTVVGTTTALGKIAAHEL